MSSIQQVVLPNNKEMQHARIVELRTQLGDWVDKGQEVMLIQIHERTLVFTSPQAGIIESIASMGHQPEPGSLLFSLRLTEEQSNSKKSESANERVNDNQASPPPSDSEENNRSIRFNKLKGIVFLAVSIVVLALAWRFYWPNQNVLVMNCKVSEYVDIRNNQEGEMVNHFYDHRRIGHGLLKDKKYEISTDSTGLPSLRFLTSDDTKSERADDTSLCDNAANNCESTMTDTGTTFVKTDDTTNLGSQLNNNLRPVLLYEFNYIDKTLYTTDPMYSNTRDSTKRIIQRAYGTFHIFYRCTDNALKNI